ncbi:sulfate ABC transporter substrate-binding protein [Alkalinema sp. FACHB-956]|uniref:sulfate ABC transporter substrate-binding protein n=1 Tax=Alkalinema sp. FACHB-956 TaxID=2692768 RepID=UPI001688B38F|nr:sulfate ABC transporter substrate-binding protein [Alkalinema sp. FACHB-956]MBD2329997.1 sulfate ABC transporter substrate-binding protein [Alkalinema sp. FACHB-956]
MTTVKPSIPSFAAVGLGLSLSLMPIGVSSAFAAPAEQKLIAQKPNKVEITLVSFAVTKAAHDKIIPLFQEKWKREKGQEVVVNRSYGGSGSQTRAVLDGLEADVVSLALALDTKRLEKAGLIQPGWEKEAPNDAIVTKSVIALVTRPGNPKKVKTWSDLANGVQVITANPKTSGGAIWNFLGLWGSVSQTGGNDNQAKEFFSKVAKNVPVWPKDARESTDIFLKKGQGDVLLNYEHEVILAEQNGDRVFYVIPPVNISIDNPIAVVDKIVDKRGTREVSEALVKFLYSPEAQREYAKVGFRPVDGGVAKEFEKKFPKVSKLYTVKDFGGWDEVQKKFFADGAIFDQVVNKR